MFKTLGWVGFFCSVTVLSVGCVPQDQGESDEDVEEAVYGANGANYSGFGKTVLCHAGSTIDVGNPSVLAHLNHGDTPGACAPPGGGGAGGSTDTGTGTGTATGGAGGETGTTTATDTGTATSTDTGTTTTAPPPPAECQAMGAECSLNTDCCDGMCHDGACINSDPDSWITSDTGEACSPSSPCANGGHCAAGVCWWDEGVYCTPKGSDVCDPDPNVLCCWNQDGSFCSGGCP